jgi:hypothetical protein
MKTMLAHAHANSRGVNGASIAVVSDTPSQAETPAKSRARDNGGGPMFGCKRSGTSAIGGIGRKSYDARGSSAHARRACA